MQPVVNPPAKRNKLIITCAVILFGICGTFFCCSALSAIGGSLPTRTATLDIAATTTHVASTFLAAQSQTQLARPTLTSTITWTATIFLSPTISLTPTKSTTPTITKRPTSTFTKTRTATATKPTPTTRPTTAQVVATSNPAGNCNPAYPGICLTHEVDCKDIPYKRFKVLPPDPYNLDRDGDGIGCES